MKESKRRSGTFLCLANHISSGSRLIRGFQKARWVCPRRNCFRDVHRVSDKSPSQLFPHTTLLLSRGLYPFRSF